MLRPYRREGVLVASHFAFISTFITPSRFLSPCGIIPLVRYVVAAGIDAATKINVKETTQMDTIVTALILLTDLTCLAATHTPMASSPASQSVIIPATAKLKNVFIDMTILAIEGTISATSCGRIKGTTLPNCVATAFYYTGASKCVITALP